MTIKLALRSSVEWPVILLWTGIVYSVLAVPVMSMYPVVTVIAAPAILGETLSLTKLLGVLLALAGVIVLVR